MKLARWPGNPIIPNEPLTWRNDQTANPDLLQVDNEYLLYFRGQEGGHDRIGVARCGVDLFDGATWEIRDTPVVDVGDHGAWDETHVLDPATVLVDERVYLYYSAVCPRCSRSVCLATSTDGIHFTKYAGNPVVIGGAPEVVYRNGVFYLYYWGNSRAATGQSGGFALYCATSSDGFSFTPVGTAPVLPTGPDGSWDSVTVETPRVFFDRDTYYMVYCGSNRYSDYPFHAGIATSTDLIHWKKYGRNPVFTRGEKGAWDEGAIWFTTVEKIDGRYYLWYEGYGGGTARTTPYGSYLTEGRSQIGLATLDEEYFFVKPAGGRR